MSAVRVAVTAEHCSKAGPWPHAAEGVPFDPEWQSPVELAIAELAGVNVDVDGDEDHWIATIGTMESGTLVVDLPDIVKERLDPYYAHDGLVMEPFDFDIEIDAWLVALLARARQCGVRGVDANHKERSCRWPLGHSGRHWADDSAGTPTGAAVWRWNEGDAVAERGATA